MISNQIGEISDRGFYVPGYGLGVGVNPDKHCGKTTSINWAGGPFNTFFYIDFNKELK